MSESTSGAGTARVRVDQEDEHADTAGALIRSESRSVSDQSAGELKVAFETGEKANRSVSGLVRKVTSEK